VFGLDLKDDNVRDDVTSLPRFAAAMGKTVVTCKIKHLQNICKNVLAFYFTCNHRKTFAKHLQKCFSVLFYM